MLHSGTKTQLFYQLSPVSTISFLHSCAEGEFPYLGGLLLLLLSPVTFVCVCVCLLIGLRGFNFRN